MKLNIDRLTMRTAMVVMALVLIGIAKPALAQTQPWDTNVISWSAPTSCTTGEPISACAVTGYRVEMSGTTTGIFATVGVTTTLAYTHTNLSAGSHCYRVIALSAQGDSLPSSVACKTNVKPVGPPNPPTNLKVDNIVAYNVTPNYQRFTYERGSRAGRVPMGASCDETRTVGAGFYAIDRPSRVIPQPAPGVVLVAHCS